MMDTYQRTIDYLRLSVTDRCNLRCLYCMPEEGVCLKRHEEILTLEELCLIAETAVGMGIRKIRITGGEPLVRRGIVDLVAMLRKIEGLDEISLTTNGTLLAGLAQPLRSAGLDRINVSLDSLDPQKYASLTRGGDLGSVLSGLDAALAAGFEPIKINCVLVDPFKQEDLDQFIALIKEKPFHVRFIELMPIGEGEKKQADYLAMEPLKRKLIKRYDLKPVDSIKTNGPAEQYLLPGAVGTLGFISAVSNHFCHRCNRLRVTADGKIKPCLDSEIEVDLMPAVRRASTKEEKQAIIKKAFAVAIERKPKGHHMEVWQEGRRRMMSQIGG